MERKLSQKAAQMRQRLFTRNPHGRSRAATMNSSAPATSTPSSRSRSATTPDSSVPAELAWDNTDTDATRYHFTDEPGYFRPASPLLDRQEVDEDLEDNVKHACALLVESIERGLPIWPSFHTQKTGLAQAPVYETRSNLQDQMTQLSLSPVALDTLIPAQTDNWDSDVNVSLQSAGNYGPCQNSFSATGTGRFYGRRLSTSPLEEPELDEERGRARGRSFATDTTSPRSRSRSRSRSSSPGCFPYSPPQLLDTAWGRDTTQIFESDDQLFPTEDAFLGEGMNWLRESLDIQNNSDRVNDWAGAQTKRGCMTSAPNTASGPAPRRFYSMRRNKSKDAFPTRDWDAFEVHGSRESGIYRGLSMRDLSMEEERKRANDFSYPVWMDRGSDSPDGQTNFDSGVQDGGRQRRKRASELLKKLTGLGMRRKDTEESRRVRTVEAMA
ncbi:hypothetical protein N7528_004246 [Penicillium herquei]|nr:hypothetical protein N7528_004246 [Penicillium herquei]